MDDHRLSLRESQRHSAVSADDPIDHPPDEQDMLGVGEAQLQQQRAKTAAAQAQASSGQADWNDKALSVPSISSPSSSLTMLPAPPPAEKLNYADSMSSSGSTASSDENTAAPSFITLSSATSIHQRGACFHCAIC